MKKQIKLAIFMAVATLVVASCGPKELRGFKKTDGGLLYKFEETNKKAQQVKVGDILVGEVAVRLNNDTLPGSSLFGKPQRFMMVQETMLGCLQEGLTKMHVGDVATFGIYADTLAKYFQPEQMPQGYVPGKGDIIFYDIHLTDIVSAKELEQEESEFQANMAIRKASEDSTLHQYLTDNKISVKPTNSGLYIIVNKKGSGAKVATGKTVKINYTGRLLDGTIFDSSIEKDAKEGKVYTSERPYEPMAYKVGETSLIPGWDEGVMNQPAGTKLTLIMPSSLGYGERGAGQLIPPYSPLRFDLEIVSVE